MKAKYNEFKNLVLIAAKNRFKNNDNIELAVQIFDTLCQSAKCESDIERAAQLAISAMSQKSGKITY